MNNDIDIAQRSKLSPISEIALKLNIKEEDYIPIGRYKAKLELSLLKSLEEKKDGNLILVTAITPTP